VNCEAYDFQPTITIISTQEFQLQLEYNFMLDLSIKNQQMRKKLNERSYNDNHFDHISITCNENQLIMHLKL